MTSTKKTQAIKRCLLSLFLLCAGYLEGATQQIELPQSHFQDRCETTKNLSTATLLFHQDGQPTTALLQLLKIVGMGPLDPSKEALLQINEWTQHHLLRQKERWDRQTVAFEPLAPQLLPLLQQLGLLEAKDPARCTYQGVLVLGASVPRIKLRLEYLIEQWKRGIHFSTLYFLSSERPLVQDHELLHFDHQDTWCVPKTEAEAMLWIWEHLDVPPSMRQLTPQLICSPMKTNSLGQTIRPTTVDTIDDWLKIDPVAGCYLVISNAPHINRQDFEFQVRLPTYYKIETVGPQTPQTMAILLDELARFIFDIQAFFSKNPK